MEFISFFTHSIIILSVLSVLYAVVWSKSRPLTSLMKKKNKERRSEGSTNLEVSLTDLMKNGHRLMDWTAELVLASPTNTVSLPSMIVTSNPLNLEHVLKTNFGNYPKGDLPTVPLRDLLGHGIFNADGEHWKSQRRTASLEFNTKNIRNFIMDIVTHEIVARLVPFLHKAAISGEVIDMQDVLDRFAFDNVCNIAFDVDSALLSDGSDAACCSFAHAFEAAAGLSLRRFQQPGFLWRLRRKLNLGYERQLNEALAVVNQFSMNVVRTMKQRSGNGCGSDILSQFIQAEDGDHSDEFLRDVITSFVLAGRDTTSTTMTWFFWNLASHPSVKEKIRDEIRDVRSKHGNPDGPFSLDEIRDMVYLHAAVTETLRLYPVVPLHMRTCASDDVLPDGTTVKAGWAMSHNVFAMGRMESLWGEDCRDYRPERWIDESGRGLKHVSPFKFPVFLAGPRVCLGKETAYVQMKAVIATVLEQFNVDRAVEGEEKREHELVIVLRMKGGFPARVSARDSSC